MACGVAHVILGAHRCLLLVLQEEEERDALRSRLDMLMGSEEQLRHELAEREAELAATGHDLRKMILENQARPRCVPLGVPGGSRAQRDF
jgi:hypothetical protein